MHEMADRWSGGDVSERVKQVLRGVPGIVRAEIEAPFISGQDRDDSREGVQDGGDCEQKSRDWCGVM